MKVAAVIAEYNPMHTGHAYHLEKTREISGADFIVALMSGNFTQRGEAAIYDKWTRSRVAVMSGVDLVLELPFAFACNSAEYFAAGAVNMIEKLGCVDIISFGSEAGRLEPLLAVGQFLTEEPEEYRRALKEKLDEGVAFPVAREFAVSKVMGNGAGEILKGSNNILGVEYVKAALKRGMESRLMTIKRKGSHFHRRAWKDRKQERESRGKENREGADLTGQEVVSAEILRRGIVEGRINEVLPFLTEEGQRVLGEKSGSCGYEERLFFLIRAALLTGFPARLKKMFGVVEGLENRLLKEVRYHEDLSDFVKAVKSKRYTETAIGRILIHILLEFEKQDLFVSRTYGRVLALNKKGRKLLRIIKDRGDMDLITNMDKRIRHPLLRYDVLSSDLYNLIAGVDLYDNSDYVRHPFVLDKEG